MKRDLMPQNLEVVPRSARASRNFGSIDRPFAAIALYREHVWTPLRTVLVPADIQARIDEYRRIPSLYK